MCGTITAIGETVEGLAIGDRVVIRPLEACGCCPACERGYPHICQNLKFLGLDTDGAFQQSWTVPAHTIHKIPTDLSLAHAALIEPVAVACHDVRRSKLVAGEEILIIGGGPIGMLITMVAIHSTKPAVDLFKFFWREIELFGARVYQAEDYERAIEMVAAGAIDCQAMITDVRPLDKINDAFKALSTNAQAMKSLIQCD
jgi:threonine dehydrogenase-like Zn-dependent dehydrogenase